MSTCPVSPTKYFLHFFFFFIFYSFFFKSKSRCYMKQNIQKRSNIDILINTVKKEFTDKTEKQFAY